MGLFSSIGNFISQNVQSAVHDVGNAGSQVLSSPIYQGVVTAAAASFGVPPQVSQASLGFTSGLASQVAGNGSSAQSEQQPTPTDVAQYNVNQPLVYTVQTPSNNAPTTQKTFMDNVKQYWYYIAIPIVAIAGWFYFKPKKRSYVKR